MGHFVVFSNTAPCKEETNMAVGSVMTCKIDMIWCHMKTLYLHDEWLWDGWNVNFIHVRMHQLCHMSVFPILQHTKDLTTVVMRTQHLPSVVLIKSSLLVLQVKPKGLNHATNEGLQNSKRCAKNIKILMQNIRYTSIFIQKSHVSHFHNFASSLQFTLCHSYHSILGKHTSKSIA